MRPPWEGGVTPIFPSRRLTTPQLKENECFNHITARYHFCPLDNHAAQAFELSFPDSVRIIFLGQTVAVLSFKNV